MPSRMKVVCVSLLLVAAAGTANAQQRRGLFGRGVTVLHVATVPAVAKELKLTDGQVTAAKELVTEDRKQRDRLLRGAGDLAQEERRARFQKYSEQRQENEEKLGEAVGPEKLKRIRQLRFQTTGLMSAFFSKETAQQLEIADSQGRQALQELRYMGDEFRSVRDDPEAMAKFLKKVDEKLAGHLTDDQKSRWKEMLGKPADEKLLVKILVAVRPRGS